MKYAIELYKNPNKRSEMGKVACLHAQKFKIEQSLKSMAEVYSEMLQMKIEYKESCIVY